MPFGFIGPWPFLKTPPYCESLGFGARQIRPSGGPFLESTSGPFLASGDAEVMRVQRQLVHLRTGDDDARRVGVATENPARLANAAIGVSVLPRRVAFGLFRRHELVGRRGIERPTDRPRRGRHSARQLGSKRQARVRRRDVRNGGADRRGAEAGQRGRTTPRGPTTRRLQGLASVRRASPGPHHMSASARSDAPCPASWVSRELAHGWPAGRRSGFVALRNAGSSDSRRSVDVGDATHQMRSRWLAVELEGEWAFCI